MSDVVFLLGPTQADPYVVWFGLFNHIQLLGQFLIAKAAIGKRWGIKPHGVALEFAANPVKNYWGRAKKKMTSLS